MNLQELLSLTVSPYMPETLVSKAAMQKIEKVAAHFPNQLTSFFGFECRLGEPEPKADFLLCIRQANGERQILAGNHADFSIPDALLAQDVWQRVQNFSKLWDTPESLLYAADNIWLEFDMDTIDTDAPVPSIFFGFDDKKNALELSQACQVAFEALLPEMPETKILQNLTLCFEALPDHAQVFQIGLMLSRNTTAIRICLSDLQYREIPIFLKKINWQGNLVDIDYLIEQITEDIDALALDIDIGVTVLPKIGLECYISPDGNNLQEKVESFYDFLTGVDLCTAEKRIALFDYCGAVNRFMCPKVWPEHLLATAAFYKNKYLSAYIRYLHHVKINYQSGQPLEAKAYLAVKHFWLPTAPMVKAYQEKIAAKNRMPLASSS